MITERSVTDSFLRRVGAFLDRKINPVKMDHDALYLDLLQKPVRAFRADGSAASWGADNSVNLLTDGISVVETYFNDPGTPAWTFNQGASGMDLENGTPATDDGWEFYPPLIAVDSDVPGGHFKAGTDDAYIRLAMNLVDVSDLNTVICGFRRVQAVDAALDYNANYTDFAYLGIVASAATALIQTRVRKNSGAVTTTDSLLTWADGATKELTVRLSSNGGVLFEIGGVRPAVLHAPTIAAPHVFDSGDFLVPSFICRRQGTGSGASYLRKLEWGPQRCLGYV